MIYLEVTFSMFCDQFERMGRKDQFTYKGKKALWAHLEETHYDDSNKWELDVVSLCCDWSEYTLKEIFKEYHSSKRTHETPEEVLEWVKENTIVLETDCDTYLVLAF